MNEYGNCELICVDNCEYCGYDTSVTPPKNRCYQAKSGYYHDWNTGKIIKLKTCPTDEYTYIKKTAAGTSQESDCT